ncbi:MAG: colicin production CvpA [Gammaproteobacteria bacterium]|nr:colicin production CvpA [Gammaproteobacteria bacterium]
MQPADIAILVLIGLPALVGVAYGFLNIAFSVLAWALALGIATKLTPFFSPMLVASIDTPILRIILAFTGLFIVSLVILTGIGFLIVKLLGRTGLTATDRILGLFFGIGLGSVIVMVVIFLAGFTALPVEPWWQASRMVEPFERVSIWAKKYLPESMAKYHGYDVPVPDTGNKQRDVQTEADT